jgi:head-to-tail connecting protein
MDTEGAQSSKYWWEQDKTKLHQPIFGVIKHLETNQASIRDANLRNLRLFSNSDILGLSSHNFSRSNNPVQQIDRLTMNIIYSMCDTVTNKIAKNKIKPMFLTIDGDRGMKKRAKKLEQFVQGVFSETSLYKKSPKAFRSGTIFGTGALKIFKQNGKIKVENRFIDQIKVDEVDGRDGNPRSMYEEMYISREVLCRMFPKFKIQIKNAKRADTSHPFYAHISDALKVVEAVHLPSMEGAGDGLRAICIETATLETEEWKKEYFPFVFTRWSNRELGFFGQGLAEQITPEQIALNRVLKKIEEAFHWAVPHMMVRNGDDVVLQHLSNRLGSVLKYTDQAPEWSTPAPVNSQYFEWVDKIIQRAYEKAGISQLSASSQKPSGLDSGNALREFNDIESERYMLVGQSWEDIHIECSERFLDLADEISEEDGKDYTVKSSTNRNIENIKWSDVKMDRKNYKLQVFPTSFLSSTPSGKLSDVQDLTQSGFFPKEFALKLLDFPDLDWAMSLFTAAIDDIDRVIEKMCDKGQYEPPEPFQNLSLGVQMVQSAYLREKDQGLSEVRLDLLRRWITDAQTMLSAQPAPQGLQPQGQAQAAPMAPPQSGLLQNAPIQ